MDTNTDDAARTGAISTDLIATSDYAASGRAGLRGIFGSLVRNDDDIVGLVAYALYKQSKLDWMQAFEKGHGRAPNDVELNSYIVGEGTSRRLATYRHLAESALQSWGDTRAGSIAEGGGVSYGKLFNYFIVALALALVILGLTARMVFGTK